MTYSAPLYHGGKMHGLNGEFFASVGQSHQVVGRADDGIEPCHLIEPLGTEDHANVVPIGFDFGAHLRNLVFGQSERIWRDFDDLHNSHCDVLPICGCNVAVGKLCNVAQRLQSYKVDSQYSYGWISSSYVNAGRGIADLCCEVPQ